MISQVQANENAQVRNRNKWVKHALDAISEIVTECSENGLMECVMPVSVLFIGSESLLEIAEMLSMIQNELDKNGFMHFVDESGQLIIKW